MSERENWTLISEPDDGTSALDRYLAERVAQQLRKHWKRTDRVLIEYKNGPKWYATGVGLAMPEDRSGVTPEGGARELVTTAREHWEKREDDPQMRVHAYGESQSGGTAKSLWWKALDFSEDSDEHEQTEAKVKTAKAKEEAANMDVLREAAKDSHSNWKDAVGMVHKTVDKVVEMAEQASQNQTALVEALRLEYQDRREAREAEEKAREDEASARRMDKLFDGFYDIGGKVLEKWLVSKMGVPPEAMSGTYSSRLAAIMKRIPADKLAAVKAELGDDAWEVLESASRGVPDDAFSGLVSRFAGMVSNHQATFMRLVGIIGDEGIVMALGKLLQEASD